jgi:Effector-associated domain 11/TIR domain
MMKQTLYDLLEQGKLKEVFTTIKKIADTQSTYFSDPLILLQSRFNRNENDNNNGVTSSSDYKVERNRIENAVKSLIDNEFDERKVPASFKTEMVMQVPMPSSNNPTISTKKGKALSVFISYSKKDIELKEELITHLASLRRRNIVSNWDDRHLIGGESWDEAIKVKMREADIILFLVSANFIATDYIWNHEIPIAEEQRQKGKARVIPIILKACNWTQLDFAKQLALPSKGVPITSFLDRDAAWLEVIESIEKVIDDILKRDA